MNSWAESFRERLQLLTDLLPVVANEPRFALKGGTAINLFEHDLPRLSVDVDLTWLPTEDYADREVSRLMSTAMVHQNFCVHRHDCARPRIAGPAPTGCP